MTLSNKENRIHQAVSADGTKIMASVQGHGPPLVLLSGLGDGQNNPFLLPELSGHFTCYSMSLRGNGLSEANTDHRPERHVEDIIAMIDSLNDPIGVAAHSRGAGLVLKAVAQYKAALSVALYEPHVIELYTTRDVARVSAALERMQIAVGKGSLAEAAQVFFEQVTQPNQKELAILSELGIFESTAPFMQGIMNQISHWQLPRPADSLHLNEIKGPVLLLYGKQSHQFYIGVVEFLSKHLPNVEVKEFAECSHFSPSFTPAPIAEEIIRFFSKN
jgi:pimeloyl-ACP methyl ester carboxylesterase